MRDKATAAAGDLYEQGKDKAAELYNDVTAKAADVYAGAKDKVAELGQANGPTAEH